MEALATRLPQVRISRRCLLFLKPCEKVQVGDFFLYVCVLVSLPAVPDAVGIDQVYQVGAKAATAFRSVKYYCGLFAL